MDIVLDLVSKEDIDACNRFLSYIETEKDISGIRKRLKHEKNCFYLYNTKAFKKTKMSDYEIKMYENNEIDSGILENLFWNLRERENVLKKYIDGEIYKDPMDRTKNISLYAINRILKHCDNDINELYKLEYNSILKGDGETQMYKIDRIKDYREKFERALL